MEKLNTISFENTKINVTPFASICCNHSVVSEKGRFKCLNCNNRCKVKKKKL